MNMQTIFDAGARDELLRRVDYPSRLAASVGKMSAAQMLEHTARVLEMATGRKPSKQALPGKLIAWMFRKSFVGEKPFGKNAPTGPSFIVRDDPALEPARERVKELIRELHTAGENGCDGRVHAFFGTMTGAEWGVTQFKHVDHHLRQFGA